MLFRSEKLAELIQTKKIPILADIRDESADDIRLILEPKSKNIDAEVLMGLLFKNSDLEIRFSLNMNVLIDGVTPKVCSLKEVLSQCRILSSLGQTQGPHWPQPCLYPVLVTYRLLAY